jgi:hypothetical protein
MEIDIAKAVGIIRRSPDLGAERPNDRQRALRYHTKMPDKPKQPPAATPIPPAVLQAAQRLDHHTRTLAGFLRDYVAEKRLKELSAKGVPIANNHGIVEELEKHIHAMGDVALATEQLQKALKSH